MQLEHVSYLRSGWLGTPRKFRELLGTSEGSQCKLHHDFLDSKAWSKALDFQKLTEKYLDAPFEILFIQTRSMCIRHFGAKKRRQAA